MLYNRVYNADITDKNGYILNNFNNSKIHKAN